MNFTNFKTVDIEINVSNTDTRYLPNLTPTDPHKVDTNTPNGVSSFTLSKHIIKENCERRNPH